MDGVKLGIKKKNMAQAEDIVHHEKTATRGDNGVLHRSLKPVCQLLLQGPEGRFALGIKKGTDRAVDNGFDQIIGINGKQAGGRRQGPGGAAFAHPHKSGDDDVVLHGSVRFFMKTTALQQLTQ